MLCHWRPTSNTSSHWACIACIFNLVLCKNCHCRIGAAQVATKNIQRWNPLGWRSERLTLCSYLLAVQSRVARCHMAQAYTAWQSHTHTPAHVQTHVGSYDLFRKRTSGSDESQWSWGSSQSLLPDLVDRDIKSENSSPLIFVNWFKALKKSASRWLLSSAE